MKPGSVPATSHSPIAGYDARSDLGYGTLKPKFQDPRSANESACGCDAGCYTAHAAIELYAEAFKSIDRLDRLEGFASEFGADFYRYPRNDDYIELTVDEWTVPESLAFGNDNLIPTRGGETITFTVTDGARYPLSGGSG